MAKAVKEQGGVAAKVEALVRPAIEQLGLSLWDVRFEKEGGLWFLRVFIDRKDPPLDTDTCEAASRAIDPILDEADPISESYLLEVGSPGLGRRLCRPQHFVAMAGQEILAGLYAPDKKGRKEVRGILMGYEDGVVSLETADGLEKLDASDVGTFKLCDDEGLFD